MLRRGVVHTLISTRLSSLIKIDEKKTFGAKIAV